MNGWMNYWMNEWWMNEWMIQSDCRALCSKMDVRPEEGGRQWLHDRETTQEEAYVHQRMLIRWYDDLNANVVLATVYLHLNHILLCIGSRWVLHRTPPFGPMQVQLGTSSLLLEIVLELWWENSSFSIEKSVRIPVACSLSLNFSFAIKHII